MIKPDYQTRSDVELLELIRDCDDKFAYEEFIKRFMTTVKDECINKCKLRNVDIHIGKQICHDTFEKVRTSKSFKKEKLNGVDKRSAIIGWLYRISSNLFYDYHNSQKLETEIHESYFDELFEYAKEVSVKSNAVIRDLSELIFSKLNNKEKEVVLTDLEIKRSQKYLPRDVNNELANRIGVKPQSVRKIRERAIVKIKNGIDEINK